jgi:transposase
MGKIEVEIVTLCATTKRLAEAVLPQVRRLGDWVKHYEHMQVDESPWLVRGVKEWMWVFTGEGVCLFLHAGDTRSRSELEAVLGPPSKGALSSDDLSLYNGYDAKAQQKCLARLLQYFKRVAKLNRPTQQALAKVLIELLEQAFGVYWQWWENRECVPYELWAQAFKQFVAEALKQWWPKAGYAAGLLRNLKIKPYQWWYFLDHPEIPPDNKHSERVFRLAVTERKVLGGSRSMAGFADTVKFVTVVQTCRAQGRAVVQFFQQTLSQGISPFKCLPLINCEARSA